MLCKLGVRSTMARDEFEEKDLFSRQSSPQSTKATSEPDATPEHSTPEDPDGGWVLSYEVLGGPPSALGANPFAPNGVGVSADLLWSPNTQPTVTLKSPDHSVGLGIRSPSLPSPASPVGKAQDVDGYVPLDGTEDGTEGRTNLMETTMNITSALVGGGVLAIPFAFGNAGLFMFVVMGIVSIFTFGTAILIGWSMEASKPFARRLGLTESALDWPILGFAAFGSKGRSLVTTVFVTEVWFILVSYLVANGINVNIVFPAISRAQGISLCGALSFLLLFLSPKLLAYGSIFGILSAFCAVASLVWSAGAMPQWFTEEHEIVWLQLKSLPEALGIIQFCVVAHSCFPSMYRNMEDKRQYGSAMRNGYIIASLFYVSVGVFAYFVFGSTAQASFMLNLGRDLTLKPLPGCSFLYIIASACYGINLQSSFPLFANALLSPTERWLGIDRSSFAVRAVWKIIFMAGTTAVAVLLRDCVDSIVSFTGCLCSTFTCMIMPLGFAWRLCKFSRSMKVITVLALVYSLYILIYGTFVNVANIAKQIGIS